MNFDHMSTAKKQQEEIQEENPVLLDLTDVDEARKAFIASEIFTRKY